MAVPLRRNPGDMPPPAIYDAEALLGGHVPEGREEHGLDGEASDGYAPDGRAPDGDGKAPLNLVRGALEGIRKEADETARLEREAEQRQAGMQKMSGMLRSILAERMVTAPAEELDATDALRAMRKKVHGTGEAPDRIGPAR